MSFFDYVLWPVKWVIEAILIGWHSLLTTLGLDGTTGLSWVLSIIGLVLVIKTLLVPLYIKQVTAQKNLALAAPEIKKIRAEYKDRLDQFSREEMARKILEAYKDKGTNPLISLVPTLLQLPILVSLFYVLNHAARTQEAGVGLFNKKLTDQFYNSEFFGGSLHQTFFDGIANGFDATASLISVIIGIMVTIQVLTLILDSRKAALLEQTPEQVKQSKRIRYGAFGVITTLILISSFFVPVALLIYLALSTVWTLVQKIVVDSILSKADEKASEKEFEQPEVV